MRKLLVFLLVLSVLLVGADVVGRLAAEAAAARLIKARLEPAQEPEVSLGGWPFLLHAFRGSFPEVEIVAGDVGSESLVLSEVVLSLKAVKASPGDLLGGDVKGVRFAKGSGRATITQSGLNDALERAGAPFLVVLEEGTATAQIEGAGTAPVQASVEGGDLLLKASGAGSVALPLPRLLDRMESIEVAVRRSKLSLTLVVGRSSLRELLGEAGPR